MSLYIDVFIQINIHNYKINLNYFFYYDVLKMSEKKKNIKIYFYIIIYN